MGPFGKLLGTVFTVHLRLSSLLLRAFNSVRRRGRVGPSRLRSTTAVANRIAAAYGQAEHATREPSSAELVAMRIELAAVLDAHNGSRRVFRYLAHFEDRFERKGLRTLEKMPVERLRRALAQFEAIVTNWSSSSLADLRSRMAVAVATRDSGARLWAPALTISKAYTPNPMPMVGRDGQAQELDFEGSREVDIDHDVSLSRFNEADREWKLVPKEAPQPTKPS